MSLNFRSLISVCILCSLLFCFQSCDNSQEPELPRGATGFFIVNEGGFGNNNSSLSFFDRGLQKVTNNIFEAKNARPLGDQAQSATEFEGRLYVVVQNSGKVEVINSDDFSSVATITDGLQSPRYFLGVSSTKGYVSDWGSDGLTGTIKVIDLNSLKVTSTIAVGKGTNHMILKDNKVYAANSGGFGRDNRVAIIDPSTDKVSQYITVGDNPVKLQVDATGNLWVGSAGFLAFNPDFSIDTKNSTGSSISKINSENKELIRFSYLVPTYGTISALEINKGGNTLYYIYDNAIYSLTTDANVVPARPFIAKGYYGISVDPFDDSIIACYAPNFSGPGKIDIYNPGGGLLSSFDVGIAPNGCAFR